MYSVVLLAAMATATETPDCHGHGGSGGCVGTCYGGCYGYGGGSGGCYGSYGCWGASYGGGYGSCWGASCYGSYGCWGGWGHSYGCHGCYGCYGCFGSCYGQMTVVPPGGKPPEGIDKPKDGKEKPPEALLPAKAKLTVELPADAKLYIDDQLMKPASGARQFSTPELQPGQTYYYMVRVEVPKDGGPTQTVSRRVLIRAGEEVTADFKDVSAPITTVKK
jgi:uncharacterized protein (TIGR03000 family)